MVLGIVQARLGSTRLPGKVLMDIEGQPMLLRVVNRARQARSLDKVIVATSNKAGDDEIENCCVKAGIDCFRGSENDVLDRYYQAAHYYKAETIARITADCPLLDPDVIDRVVEVFLAGRYDYVSNVLRYTYPDGLDVEVFSFQALERAWKESAKLMEREHVTPYLRNSKLFKTVNVENSENLSDHRWTVDKASDLEFVRKVFQYSKDHSDLKMKDVLEILKEHPELMRINNDSIMNEGYYRTLFQQGEGIPYPKRSLEKSRELFERSRRVIPGCAQTFSKGYTQYVQGVAPIFLQKGKGCRVWDVDGNEYIDYIQGLLPNILGYANEEVNAAAAAQLNEGHSFSLPHPLEVELAERLVKLIPCAEMVRFGKNGSDATSGAIRAARACTGRARIACCGYHGWQDWYIGSTTRHLGVPEAVRQLTHPFPYNDLQILESLFDTYPGEFAAVIMEPVNFVDPAPGYLQGVKELVHHHGALLIFDEICTGFHLGLGGAQKLYGVIPDLACFGKAMGNGFPISCVVGRADIMKIFEEIFFSFTFGGEAASLAAALKVLDILETTDTLERMTENGKRLKDGFNVMAKMVDLGSYYECIGYPTWSLLKFRDHTGQDSMLHKSLFQQEVINRGILLSSSHNISGAHSPISTEQTLESYVIVFKTLAKWLSDPHPEKYLDGEIISPIFRVR